MLTALKSINLALAFILELAMLAAFAYWGLHVGSSMILKILLAISIPLLAAAAWGTFMAPNSRRRLEGPAYLALKIVLFGLGVGALILAGQRLAGIVLAAAFVANTVLLSI